MVLSRTVSVRIAALALTALLAAPGAARAQGAVVKVGEKVPDFAFQTLLNHDGRRSLAEFRGSVVLLDWWGYHCPPCLGYAVPHAIELQEKFGKDGLVCVLMESQQLPPEELLGFMMQKFPKNRCFVTSEQPFRTENQKNFVPFSAVIGVDGTLLLDGGTSALGKKIDATIEEELKKIKKGWGKTPEIAKARALLHGKGLVAEAAAALDAAEKGVKPEAREDFDAARAEAAAKLESRKAAVAALKAEGRFVAAQKAAAAYQAAVKGDAEREKEAAALAAEFSDAETAKELKADAALTKLWPGFAEKSPGAEAAAAFETFAKKNAGTKAAERAKTLAAAAAYKPK
jgi:thiol-disulfide isomerase/thioredoxin